MDSDWLDGSWASNYDNPVFLTSDSPGTSTDAEPVSPVAEKADQPSGAQALPLLRLSGWDSEKQYDKHNPVCIHYDFQWKISQREKIRARRVFSDTDSDLVLAPSDFWKVKFHPRLRDLCRNEAVDAASRNDARSWRSIGSWLTSIWKV
jgi:hypothetical protein